MERERRYLIFKLRDTISSLTPTECRILDLLADKVACYRDTQGKHPLECVVVESDWPEYEPTWKAIEDRMAALQGDRT